MENSEMIRKRLSAEIPAVRAMLHDRIEDFFSGPCQETFSEVCNAMISAVVYGLTCYVPIELSNGEIVYYFEMNSRNEYAYVICGSTEELSKCGNGTGAVMKIKDLLVRALKEEDSRINGVIIKPHHEPRQYLLQLTKVNVNYILQNAEELINSQDPKTQAVLREGLSD